MFTLQDVLPVHVGYAMGNIIRKEDLELPILRNKREKIEKILFQEIEKMRVWQHSESCKLLMQDRYGSEIAQMSMTSAESEFKAKREEYRQICNRIGELSSRRVALSSPLQEMLPLDSSLSEMKVVIRGFESETTVQLSFSKVHSSLNQKVQEFIACLLPTGVPSSFMNSEDIERMARNMNDVVSTGSKVFLVGSFISLDRVRVFDPLVIRGTSRVSEELKRKCSQYYVLTEAVLGAAFIGCGTHVAETEHLIPDDESIETGINEVAMSRISMLTFISQGAIPKIKRTEEPTKLWDVYLSWKKILSTNKWSGYPTGYKFRHLEDVLKENGISVEPAGSASSSYGSSNLEFL